MDDVFLDDFEKKVAKFKTKDVWTQIIINGSMNVPESKYSIEQVHSINAKIKIISRKVVETPAIYNKNDIVCHSIKNEEGKISTGRKLVIEGLICTTVSYVALTENQSVNSFEGQIPFSAFIVLPKDTCLEDNFEVYSLIEQICIKSVCDKNVNLTFAVLLTAEKTLSTNCNKSQYKNSGIDCMKNDFLIKGLCSKGEIQNLVKDSCETLWTEIDVPELLTIPSAKPDAKQILTLTSKVEIMCQDIVNTPKAAENYEGLMLTGLKLLVHAVLRQRITYISNTDCKSVHSAHFDVPFSAYVVLPPKVSSLSKYKIRTCIEDIYACILGERQIFKNTTLFIKAEPIDCD